MNIDSHQHFWRYSAAEYPWIDETMGALRRDFLPGDLRPELDRAGFDGCIAVQTCHTMQETQWLLDVADQDPFIRGVIGWVPLTDPRVSEILSRLADRPKLKAIRHIIQAEPDGDFILRKDFNAGLRALAQFGLVYDILIFERHLPQTIRFVDLHPNQIFVLDHIAKPRIKDRALSPWRENITKLAKRENVYCKISGMVTEADHQAWTPEDLDPYFDSVLEAFGPRRILFGSDWPVCLLASSYGRWVRFVSDRIAPLSASERACILGGTAIQTYRLA